MNCFFYDRNIPGLAATTDQAIVSERPLSVSKNDTFRHILAYMPPYPEIGLKESIKKSITWVQQMKRDWSPSAFAFKFEEMLFSLLKKGSQKKMNKEFFEIPILKKNFIEKLKRKYRKYKRFINLEKIKYAFKTRKKKIDEEPI